MRKFSGIWFLDQHSYRGLGVTISARDVGAPNKVKVKQTLPFSNITYDFSHLYGAQVFEERQMTYTFDIMDPGVIDTNTRLNVIKTRIVNWLTNSQGKQPLYDDVYPQYYFLAEVESGAGFTENWTNGTLDVTFTAYPFMISELPEGHDIWDEFNFELDVAQNMTYYPIQSTFKPLNVGDRLTIGIWAREFEEGYNIQRDLLGRSYVVDDVRESDYYVSERAYYVSELDRWVVEQDVVEAQDGNAEFTLINSGTSSVVPTVTLSHDMTIIKNDDTVYNIQGGATTNDLLSLESGENHFVVAVGRRVSGNTINFEFHKELI